MDWVRVLIVADEVNSRTALAEILTDDGLNASWPLTASKLSGSPGLFARSWYFYDDDGLGWAPSR